MKNPLEKKGGKKEKIEIYEERWFLDDLRERSFLDTNYASEINNWKPEERTEFRNTHFSNIFLKNISRNVFLKRVQFYQRDKKRKKTKNVVSYIKKEFIY